MSDQSLTRLEVSSEARMPVCVAFKSVGACTGEYVTTSRLYLRESKWVDVCYCCCVQRLVDLSCVAAVPSVYSIDPSDEMESAPATGV